MAETAIEWATHVYNPFTGCDRVSPGCANCYAIPAAASIQRRERGRIRVAAESGKPAPVTRYQADGDPRTSGPGFGFTVHWDKLTSPERFPARARVFVNSMSDVFHEDAPTDAIAQLFAVFASRPDVTWMVLTKRAERMHQLLNTVDLVAEVAQRATGDTLLPIDWPLPNVWMGVTIENRAFVHRADLLRATPAAIRFISAEPLLGPLIPDGAPDATTDDLWSDGRDAPGLNLYCIDWLICGGESGSRHRPMRIQWARALRDACEAAGTAFFFKQWGGARPKSGGRELDGRTWDEIPASAAQEVAHVG